jgi:hypothetical protein
MAARPPLANQLIQTLVDDPEIVLFYSPQRRAHIGLQVDGGGAKTYSVFDVAVERHLIKLLLALDKTPAKTLVSTIIAGLEALAFDGPCRAVYRRVANLDTSVVIDLADDTGRVIVCTPGGWEIVDEPAVAFVRPPGMLPLPHPEPQTGALDEFRAVCAPMSTDAFALVLGWLITALVGRAPFPLLSLCGGQGSGKSSTARMLRGVVDPNVAPLRSLPASERDLAVMADNSYLLAFDNASHIEREMSDVLCRFTSGGGYSTRRLYRDRDEELFDVACPVIVTAIDQIVRTSDLADRTLAVRINPLSTRITEAAINARYGELRGAVLATLLDGVCAALAPGQPEAGELPRLADAAVAADAGLAVLGFGHGAFSCALHDANAQGGFRPRARVR